MRTLANWLNEMQRIQEDYGAELAQISNNSSSLFDAQNARFWPLTDLNCLQLFAHVRWLNPSGAAIVGRKSSERGGKGGGEEKTLNCVLFVFRPAVVVLERKRKILEKA